MILSPTELLIVSSRHVYNFLNIIESKYTKNRTNAYIATFDKYGFTEKIYKFLV
ncbi:hypothetical protein SH2C18_16160 [Clostridium sediminicola]